MTQDGRGMINWLNVIDFMNSNNRCSSMFLDSKRGIQVGGTFIKIEECR